MTMHLHLPMIIDSFAGGGATAGSKPFLDADEVRHARFGILSVGAEVRRSMAVRAQRNHVARIIRTTVRQSPNMVGLKVRRAIWPVERRGRPAVFTAAVCPSIDIGAYQSAPLERADHDLPLAGRHLCCRDSSRAQIGYGDAGRYGRPLVGLEKSGERAEFKDDRLTRLSGGVGSITKVKALVYELVLELDAGPNLPKNQDVPPVLSVISDSTVTADHLHVTGLAFSRILEHPVRADRILVAVRFALLPRDEEDRAGGVRRCNDAALLLSTKARMDICAPVVDPALFKSPRHKFAPQSVALSDEANGARVNNLLTDITGSPLTKELVAANRAYLRVGKLWQAQA